MMLLHSTALVLVSLCVALHEKSKFTRAWVAVPVFTRHHLFRKKQSNSVKDGITGNYQEEGALPEERMRLLWKTEPFTLVRRHMSSLLKSKDRNRLDDKQPFHFLSVENEHLNKATSPQEFATFYTGRFPSRTEPNIANKNIAPERKRRTASYRLDFAYQGESFCGWQKQPEYERYALPSVQTVMEDYFTAIIQNQSKIDIRVAGRTDASVHAFGQVGRVRIPHTIADRMPLSLDSSRSVEDYLYDRLLQLAAEDNWTWYCWSVRRVSEKFHPSFGAKSRSYVYMIDAKHICDALCVKDILSFTQRCNVLLGGLRGKCLDYFSMSYGKLKTETSMCTLFHARARLMYSSPCTTAVNHTNLRNNSAVALVVELTGDRFLRRMVRKLVATLLQLALQDDASNSATLLHILRQRDRRLTAMEAPGQGLVFVQAALEDC